MKVTSALGVGRELENRAEETFDLRRRGLAGGVGQTDVAETGIQKLLHYLQHALRRHVPFVAAAEG